MNWFYQNFNRNLTNEWRLAQKQPVRF